ncbi:MAG: hypothetical protein A3C82_01010 [Candidatus Wildermuthbacteria bacterium RIFCSPHIGHO2_02_FULL_47_12]|uniref:Uncharacterized protein n=1 Tax=Candidatus Wildermuthbacteria bacterium RIFCSPHIGHO2_02_FULL_47_12 TaxID=1802451 RepID=A0A1G2R2B9_9BACT|nr:MAG: hypothetical protein A3C82_01010 [Candidatus Wildermuthbacteria bacterium RIFCSPHIGHO2_02_FULL_47_12]
MEQEFITIAEAVRLTGQSDIELMRLLKDRMEAGNLDIESITRKEQRGDRMMYLISKAFLLKELDSEGDSQEDAPQEPVKEPEHEQAQEQKASLNVLLEAKNEVITILQGVIETKDKQMESLSKKIDELIERDRETNFLLRGLQERIFALEGPKEETPSEEKKNEAIRAEKHKNRK